MFTAAVSLCVTAASLLLHCSEFVSCRSERSLACENLMCNVIVETLCRYDKICLLSIDNIDNLMIGVHLHTHIYIYIYDIANKNLNCNMMPRYWVISTMLLGCMTGDVNTIAEPETQCHDIGLLRLTCLNAPYCLDCMTEGISIVAEPKTQCHDNGLLRLTCWVKCVYMHYCC